jgi:hypothetical protein
MAQPARPHDRFTWLFSAHIVLTVVLIIGVFNHLRVLGDKETGGLVFDTKAVNDANGWRQR